MGTLKTKNIAEWKSRYTIVFLLLSHAHTRPVCKFSKNPHSCGPADVPMPTWSSMPLATSSARTSALAVAEVLEERHVKTIEGA